jgi:nucleoside-diphosphate-sugar epimerase
VRALVTGGAGFIGSHLVEALLRRGDAVRVLDSFATGSRRNLAAVCDDVDVIEGDVRSYERVNRAAQGCDVVFHLAAVPSVPHSIADPIADSEINVGGTLNVLLVARDQGVRRVVFASSCSVYGDAACLPLSEASPARPLVPYAASKLAAEHQCRAAAVVYGVDVVALRYFNVFGPRQDPRTTYAAVVPRFIAAMLDGRSPAVFGTGEQTRDFVHVADVVEANLLAARAGGVAGEVFNVASGERRSVNDLVDVLNRVLGRRLQATYGPPRPGDVLDSFADIGRSAELLGYRPAVGFAEGLAATIECHEQSRAALVAG